MDDLNYWQKSLAMARKLLNIYENADGLTAEDRLDIERLIAGTRGHIEVIESKIKALS
jgi:hypothetical protein